MDVSFEGYDAVVRFNGETAEQVGLVTTALGYLGTESARVAFDAYAQVARVTMARDTTPTGAREFIDAVVAQPRPVSL
jgi:hypothetical protein